MKVNGEAIYATTASPFKTPALGPLHQETSAGRRTTLYLHVFDWPDNGRLLVPGLKSPVESASLLADGSPLTAVATPEGLAVTVPATAPDPISSTVVLKIKGAPQVEVALTSQEPDGSLRLLAEEAITHGGQVKFEAGGNRDCIGFWINPSDWVEWQFKVTQPGRFTLTADIAAVGSGSFVVSTGNQKLQGKAPNTGDYGRFQKLELGTVELTQPGKTSIAVKPVKEGWQPFNLKSLALQPAK